MARPKKKGIDYFPVDVKMDDEITLILAKHGAEGFGILVILWQIIYNNGFYVPWTEKELLLYNNRFYADSNKVNDVINECLKWEIFDSKLYNKHKILTSCGIQKRFVEAISRRESVEVDKRYWMLSDVNANINFINVDDNPQNGDNNPQSKEKDKIEQYKIDLWKMYPRKEGKKKYLSVVDKLLKQHGYEQLVRCIQRYVPTVSEKKYLQHGSTFFNSGYVDYLDENWTETSNSKPIEKINKTKVVYRTL